jgi:RNA polymerase sigma factor (sigma-70 family)
VAGNRSNLVIQPLLEALGGPDATGTSDGRLLQQFLAQRDQAAFAALVKRHGPMVLGVCRRIVGNAADAEDAFQATFLVLVRKARLLTSGVIVGDWLHGVARRTALKAKTAIVRRRIKEQTLAHAPKATEESRNDWRPLLDEALDSLPQKHRTVIVLCDLEGKTRWQAAAQLGWPEGTVAGRLARGRALLSKRLLRGIQALSGVLPELLAGDTVQAALPPDLIQATAQAAAVFAAGRVQAEGALSTNALRLAQGVIRSMFCHKMKMIGVGVVVAMMLAAVGGWGLHLFAVEPQAPQLAASSEQQQPAAKKVPTERDTALAKAAQAQWEGRWKEYVDGKTTTDFVLPWSINWLKAELRLTEKKAERLAFHEAHLERLKEIEKAAKTRFDAGIIPRTQYHQVVYYRIEAEIWLEDLRRGK